MRSLGHMNENYSGLIHAPNSRGFWDDMAFNCYIRNLEDDEEDTEDEDDEFFFED